MELLWVALVAAVMVNPSRAVFDCRSNACTAKGKRHVLCTYPNPTPAYECGNILSKGLKDWEKKLIVDRHNELRAYVAQGFEIQGRPGPQPGASNMRILSWDPELAEIAQRWVERCHFENAPCVDVERFDVGQSYVMHYNDGDVITSNITALVNYMYAHVKDMDSTKVCKNKFDPRSYLYTNMVWAKSYRIGCGSLLYRTDLLKLTLYCLYGPKGNIPGKPVYQTLHT